MGKYTIQMKDVFYFEPWGFHCHVNLAILRFGMVSLDENLPTWHRPEVAIWRCQGVESGIRTTQVDMWLGGCLDQFIIPLFKTLYQTKITYSFLVWVFVSSEFWKNLRSKNFGGSRFTTAFFKDRMLGFCGCFLGIRDTGTSHGEAESHSGIDGFWTLM